MSQAYDEGAPTVVVTISRTRDGGELFDVLAQLDADGCAR
jgi:hypothetical protein